MSEEIRHRRHEEGENQPESMIESFDVCQNRLRVRLQNCFSTLFGSSTGGTYAHRGEEGFSGDAASLYVLISLANEKGDNIPELMKVGWGEYSRETFESDRYQSFHNFPIDIYCVSQADSFFASEKLLKDMASDPAKFLSEHSLFVANSGKVVMSKNIDWKTRHLEKDIKATDYDQMLRTLRNHIIKEKCTPEDFAAFMRRLPDDPGELGKYMRDLDNSVDWINERDMRVADEKTKADIRNKSIMHLVWGMGVEMVGIAVGDKKAMESVIALKKSFNFETNSFT